MRTRQLIWAVVFASVIIPLGCFQRSNQISNQSQTVAVASQSPSPTPTPSPTKSVQAQQINKTWASRFSIRTVSINKNHEGSRGYEISVDCPLIIKARTRGTRRFNRWMLRKIRGYVAQFESLERAAEIHDKRKRLPKVGIDESLEIGYVVYYSDNRLISLRLTHTVMALGQMHPIDYYETINYDLKKGHDLRAATVFRRGYLKAFSSYARRELRNKYDLDDQWSSEMLERGTRPYRHNFKNWNIVPDGLLISFEDYQVGPHAFGQPEMIVPFQQLKRVIHSDSVCALFTREKSARN
ncbi:MAG TPA: hypothetical protein DC054_24760 [Blastocatellia bacterium]|nr:hypothetical protein [Blastocatellia bacterium]